MNMLSQHNLLPPFTFLVLLVAALLFQPVNAQAKEKKATEKSDSQPVQFNARADEEFLLKADYYSGEKRSAGVIVLHDCKSDRSRYRLIANGLFKQGLHTLALDLRGYGDSVSPAFSRDIIKQNAVDIVGYQSEMALLTTYWQDDLMAAYQFLRGKVDKSQGISIVTSGCSAAYGVALAEKILLKSIVMITPAMTYADKERYKNLIDIPSYFITSSHHADSYKTAQELFSWNGSKRTKMQVFKGERYNYQLIARKNPLINDIAHWIHLNASK